jgi:hypothetical protein
LIETAHKWEPYVITATNEIIALQRECEAAPAGWAVICGTWKGGDVMALRECAPRRILVVDSFLGLSEPGPNDRMHKGDCDPGGLAAYMQNFKEAGVTPPDAVAECWINSYSLVRIEPRPVALLFLDLDHYLPTRDCLDRFLPMMVPDGRVIAHDFTNEHAWGAESACREFGEWEPIEGWLWRMKR